jgi:exopolyphosphatase / guanosine-5'-triphosphate,3'-diphosphate pyrophosphatase
MKYAAIDVGTNTALLLIMERGGADREIIDCSTVTRLGEGLKEKGRLSDPAMERGLRTLTEYRSIIDCEGVDRIIAVGTSALREASNSAEFLKLVEEGAGIRIRVISEQEEAFFTYLSVRDDPLIPGQDLLIVDIGGGSTEIIKADRKVFGDFVSLPVGAVKLTEMFVRKDPPGKEELKALEDFAFRTLSLPFSGEEAVFVGTGGTATTLASLLLGFESYEKDRIHGLSVRREHVDVLIERMSGMTSRERRLMKGMEKGREDIILQGTIFLRALMHRLGFDTLVVSTKGVRYGVIMAAEAHGAGDGH